MSSQALLKKIASLKIAKYRQKYRQFTVEGLKGVDEIIHSDYTIHNILATKEMAVEYSGITNIQIVSNSEMNKISNFSTAPGLLALVEMKEFDWKTFISNAPITLCLDGISDPGNLGTIIRTADWFGINQIILSSNCTDIYNPKALSASMGSFARCKFIYVDLATFLKDKFSVGCFLNGSDLHNFNPKFPLFLVVGSESHGISHNVTAMISEKLTIPGYGHAESLNAGVAAGIVMESLTRKIII